MTPSLRQKQEKPQPQKLRKRPEIVALPDPEPEPEPIIAAEPTVEPEIMSEIWEPEVPEIKAPPPAPKPNPAVRRAHAPPPRIPEVPVRKIALPATLKPKVRWNNRAPAMDPSGNHNGNGNGNAATELPAPPLPPAQNVIPMKAPRPALPLPAPLPRPPQAVAPRAVPVVPRAVTPVAPRPVMQPAPIQPQLPRKPAPAPTYMRPVQPRPAPAPRKLAPPVVSSPQADFFEMFAENSYESANRRRREMKFRRFLACEAAALLILLPLVILGFTLNISAPALRWIMNILTIASAITAVVIPIIFYAANPTLPELDR
ncbi:MAG TPA: hypothetical protein VLK27_00995 [Chthoniobacterales bacterium]|nr:hypothetical protein [Chthoniobacterales bacterium]